MATGADAASAGQEVARLAQTIEAYLADHPAAALLEDGRVLFDMRSARYAVSESHGRCLLQLWSEERNLIRTVVGVQERAQCLRLATRRMGAAKPQTLELVPTSDRRTPTAREAARRNYQRLLERVLTRQFIGSKVDGLRSAMDLEHSFGPAYVRGRLLRGTAADAVIGVSECRVGTDRGRRSDAGNPLAGPLPAEGRRAAALWRAQGHRASRSLADDGRAHGLAEPRRRRFPAFHSRRAQRRAGRGGFSRHRQPGRRGWFTPFPPPRPSSARRPESTGLSRSFRPPPGSGSRSCPARPPK
jgi:hypothetical protein